LATVKVNSAALNLIPGAAMETSQKGERRVRHSNPFW
jgi:hypothetical protein